MWLLHVDLVEPFGTDRAAEDLAFNPPSMFQALFGEREGRPGQSNGQQPQRQRVLQNNNRQPQAQRQPPQPQQQQRQQQRQPQVPGVIIFQPSGNRNVRNEFRPQRPARTRSRQSDSGKKGDQVSDFSGFGDLLRMLVNVDVCFVEARRTAKAGLSHAGSSKTERNTYCQCLPKT